MFEFRRQLWLGWKLGLKLGLNQNGTRMESEMVESDMADRVGSDTEAGI